MIEEKQKGIRLKEKLQKIKANDIMSRFAITIHDDASVMDLAHLMMRFKISGVPVVSSEGNIVGIVTATDLFRLAEEIIDQTTEDGKNEDQAFLSVSTLMTKEVISISEDTPFSEIIHLMCSKNLHTLPVMDGKNIMGVVGRRDVINTFYKTFGDYKDKTN